MNIYIFRGKSATGKTTLTNILSQKLQVSVLRKCEIKPLNGEIILDSIIPVDELVDKITEEIK